MIKRKYLNILLLISGFVIITILVSIILQNNTKNGFNLKEIRYVRVCNDSPILIDSINVSDKIFFVNIDSKDCSEYQQTDNLQNFVVSVMTEENGQLYRYETVNGDIIQGEEIIQGKYTISIKKLEKNNKTVIEYYRGLEFDVSSD